MRWRGQSHELTVPGRGDLASAFRRAYRRLYGQADAGRTAEIVTMRVRAAERPAQWPSRIGAPAARRNSGSPRPAGIEPMVLGGRRIAVPWWRREDLPPGTRIAGPARIVEYSATTIVSPGWSGRVEAGGTLRIIRRWRRTGAGR